MSGPTFIRGAKVLLYTSLVRADLFTWMESLDISWNRAMVDTWEILDHPGQDGATFTLYACTVVVFAPAEQMADVPAMLSR